jgi:DNA-binding MarR family transcriptional regulator
VGEAVGIPRTYRTARVLTTIAANPGTSNRAVAAAAGIVDEGQASKLLKRLERLGLIENIARDREPGEANAWRLTTRGVEVERTLRAKGERWSR